MPFTNRPYPDTSDISLHSIKKNGEIIPSDHPVFESIVPRKWPKFYVIENLETYEQFAIEMVLKQWLDICQV